MEKQPISIYSDKIAKTRINETAKSCRLMSPSALFFNTLEIISTNHYECT
jgi:hypothetical protein